MYQYKRLWKIELIGVFSVAVLFTFFYFIYAKTQIEWFAYISIVNKSVWEHLKIAFYSYVFFIVIEFFLIGKEYYGFWYGKSIASYLFPFLILISYYTYIGMFGKNLIGVTIGLWFTALVITQYISYRLILSKRYPIDYTYIYIIGIVIGIVLFTYWTISPPQIPLFIDPIQY